MKHFPLGTLRVDDPEYPSRLSEIAQPPEKLWYRGDIHLLRDDRLLAIVGARKATPYGKQVIQTLATEAVTECFVTVSGLAYGIDGAVHTQTLDAGGKTIAVLGSSVLDGEIYPHAHERLAHRILENGGLLLSEFPPGTPTYPGNFPQRNRIISGLCPATVIVEAAQKSGSLITARFAREQNREVFAVPGSLFSAQSVGTNWLIASGANVWSSMDSLFSALPYLERASQQEQQLDLDNLNTTERIVYDLLHSGSMNTQDLCMHAGLNTPEILQAITMLCMSGLVHESNDGQYTRASATLRA